jgi:hypothetical protein
MKEPPADRTDVDPRFFVSPSYLRRDDAVYDELHQAGESVHSVLGELVNAWTPLRRILRSPETRGSTAIRDLLWRGQQDYFPLTAELTDHWLVFTHGAVHDRLRSLGVEIVDGALRQDLCRTFGHRLDEILGVGADAGAVKPVVVDVVGDIIKPSVAAATARHFGDGESVEPHVDALSRLAEPLLDMTCRRRDLVRAEEVCAAVRRAPTPIAEHLARSCNPTVRALATGRHERYELPVFELVGLLSFLIGAASETTNVLVASLAHALADADLWQSTVDDCSPAVVERIVAEGLRLASPIQTIGRVVGDSDGGGGRPVLLNLAAANRDPAVFAEPHGLCLQRGDGRRPHVAFGHGAHYCVGAGTARDIGAIFVRALVTRGRRPVVAGAPRVGFRYFLMALRAYVIELEVDAHD